MSRPLTSDMLVRAIREPGLQGTLSGAEWTELLKRGRLSMLLGKLARGARAAGIVDDLPRAVQRVFGEADVIAAENARMLRWEVARVGRALMGSSIRPVILKGGAYIVAGLRAGQGRLASDLDILVAHDELEEVERRLKDSGWQEIKQNEYDDHYYRAWMHELPPLRHLQRHTVVDVHHTILPPTGRLNPDAAALLAAAVPLGDTACRMLSPADMVLHAAVHLFQDSDFAYRLRDVMDIHELLSEFGTAPGFWEDLEARAALHGLRRPLFYALYFARETFGTAVPDEALRAAAAGRPSSLSLALMSDLIGRAMPPEDENRPVAGVGFARWLLFIRSHWLRMPPLMLARHLSIKFLRRFLPVRAGAVSQGLGPEQI